MTFLTFKVFLPSSFLTFWPVAAQMRRTGSEPHSILLESEGARPPRAALPEGMVTEASATTPGPRLTSQHSPQVVEAGQRHYACLRHRGPGGPGGSQEWADLLAP